MSLIPLPPSLIPFLKDYLPQPLSSCPHRPFITLTYAQSLDSKIASKPGQQTKISHLETKTMTHYLRSKHDAILVGIGTVLADDPKLNCRYHDPGSDVISSPRPIIIDPHHKWKYSKSQLYKIHESNQGLSPFIIIDESISIDPVELEALDHHGGKFIPLPLFNKSKSESWESILSSLLQLNLKSIMIEGGAMIINDLLSLQHDKKFIDSLIITIGPVFLGSEGVTVHPHTNVELDNINWWSGIQDSILCANVSTK
ncbi:5-amino-6-uracil reductase [Scheffersomyces coipomensis]|uniref:5-amino-6-uracil reductase n=1 Tax=Scheffersomyces coipomensis TaxID=1788519 RepID=UPI00315DF831